MDDLMRKDLQDIEDVLGKLKHYFHSQDHLNSALQLYGEVRHSPMYTLVANAYAKTINLVNRLDGRQQTIQSPPQGKTQQESYFEDGIA